jgi:hypothetical protein
MSYRPLLVHHLSDGPLADGLDRSVELIETSEQMEALLAAPDVAQWCPTTISAADEGRWEQQQKVGVVLRDRRGEYFNGLLVGGLGDVDECIAHLNTFWVPNAAWLRASGANDILAAGWLMLFRALAQRGAVGVTAGETWSGRDFVDVLRRIAGFRPSVEFYSALGLSPADSKVVLVEWCATVEDQQLTRFATRPELDEAAHRELIGQLDRYFRAVPASVDADTDPVTGERLTIRGDIGLDGVRGWGSGKVHPDWFNSDPDNVPAGAGWSDVDARTRTALSAWLRDQVDQAE